MGVFQITHEFYKGAYTPPPAEPSHVTPHVDRNPFASASTQEQKFYLSPTPEEKNDFPWGHAPSAPLWCLALIDALNQHPLGLSTEDLMAHVNIHLQGRSTNWIDCAKRNFTRRLRSYKDLMAANGYTLSFCRITKCYRLERLTSLEES